METITISCDGQRKWLWTSIMADLIEQGGLKYEDIYIDPLSFQPPNFFVGTYKGSLFAISWARDQFLLLSMQELSQKLVDAFTRVLEYHPFCCYEKDGYMTVEWHKRLANVRILRQAEEEEQSNDR